MTKKVVIFGVSDNAQLAHYYLSHDSEYEVAAFTVNTEYIDENAFCGLDVLPFEEIETLCPPDTFCMFAPLSGRGMNKARESIYNKIQTMGYEMISYVSSKATVLSDSIGQNCFILEDNTIQPFVEIGDNTILWSGNHIGHHGKIGDHCFITSHVVVSGHCKIGNHSFIGVNATLRDGLTLAEGTFVAMGSNMTRDSEAWCAYAGNPVKKLAQPSDSIKIYFDD